MGEFQGPTEANDRLDGAGRAYFRVLVAGANCFSGFIL
jgi:hypothetical protein